MKARTIILHFGEQHVMNHSARTQMCQAAECLKALWISS